MPSSSIDGYAISDIIYCWKNKKDNYRTSIKLSDDIQLPQFRITHHKLNQNISETSTGRYSRLKVAFILSRNIGFYVIQIYLPSTLIVIISWVSFWLSRDATPARVALGVTTVLTMTTLMTTTNSSMPKVSYIKSIDLYLGVCFVMVFASLLEYAAVGYLNKKLRMRREKKLKRFNKDSDSLPSRKSAISEINTLRTLHTLLPRTLQENGSLYDITPSYSGIENSSDLSGITVECDCDLDSTEQTSGRKYKRITPLKSALMSRRKLTAESATPSRIDKYSRMIFPFLFAIFNAIYWAVSYHKRNKLAAAFRLPFPRFNGSTPETDTCFADDLIYTGVFVPDD